MRIYSQDNFATMPWKNGGGITTELFSIKNEEGEILFRISVANVNQDGPFSLYKDLDRILMLVKGDGFVLNFHDYQVIINERFRPIMFSGDEHVDCKLINGESVDFNVMTNKKYGTSIIDVKYLNPGERISSNQNTTYLFFPDVNEMYEIQLNESFINNLSSKALVYQISLLTYSLKKL